MSLFLSEIIKLLEQYCFINKALCTYINFGTIDMDKVGDVLILMERGIFFLTGLLICLFLLILSYGFLALGS